MPNFNHQCQVSYQCPQCFMCAQPLFLVLHLPPIHLLSLLCNTPLEAHCVVRVWEAFRNESEKLIMCVGLRGDTAGIIHVK